MASLSDRSSNLSAIFVQNFQPEDTRTSMNTLDFKWKAQSQIAEAIVLMRHCVQQRQRVPKASHPDFKSSLAALEEWEAE
jgi:hypothetical protein